MFGKKKSDDELLFEAASRRKDNIQTLASLQSISVALLTRLKQPQNADSDFLRAIAYVYYDTFAELQVSDLGSGENEKIKSYLRDCALEVLEKNIDGRQFRNYTAGAKSFKQINEKLVHPVGILVILSDRPAFEYILQQKVLHQMHELIEQLPNDPAAIKGQISALLEDDELMKSFEGADDMSSMLLKCGSCEAEAEIEDINNSEDSQMCIFKTEECRRADGLEIFFCYCFECQSITRFAADPYNFSGNAERGIEYFENYRAMLDDVRKAVFFLRDAGSYAPALRLISSFPEVVTEVDSEEAVNLDPTDEADARGAPSSMPESTDALQEVNVSTEQPELREFSAVRESEEEAEPKVGSAMVSAQALELHQVPQSQDFMTTPPAPEETAEVAPAPPRELTEPVLTSHPPPKSASEPAPESEPSVVFASQARSGAEEAATLQPDPPSEALPPEVDSPNPKVDTTEPIPALKFRRSTNNDALWTEASRPPSPVEADWPAPQSSVKHDRDVASTPKLQPPRAPLPDPEPMPLYGAASTIHAVSTDAAPEAPQPVIAPGDSLDPVAVADADSYIATPTKEHVEGQAKERGFVSRKARADPNTDSPLTNPDTKAADEAHQIKVFSPQKPEGQVPYVGGKPRYLGLILTLILLLFMAIVAFEAPASAPALSDRPDPTTATMTQIATEISATNLRQLNLIGIFGRPGDRRALIRLGSGRYVKVGVGDRLDAGQVMAISNSALLYVKEGRNILLE